MFDMSLVISYDALKQTQRFEITKFPDGVLPHTKSLETDWFKLNYYAHENSYHQWFAENDRFIVLSLGQVFFRFDASIKASSNQVLSELLPLISEDATSVTQYLKGNYVLFIIDKTDKNLSIISSKSCHYDVLYAKIGSAIYITTSLRTLLGIGGYCFKESPVSLIETSLFDYPLGRATLYEDVYHLNQGTILKFCRAGLEQKLYHDWTQDIHARQTIYNWKDTYKQVVTLFDDIVQMQIQDKPKLISALTSGFDSRTMLSALMRYRVPNVKYYSWGRSEQVDVAIPKLISEIMHLDYYHCNFADDFHKDYVKSALDAIEYSNGRATLRRANHFFYYKQLSRHSNCNFTGLYGSELLRPISTIGHMFNNSFLALLLDSSIDNIRAEVMSLKHSGYLSAEFIDSNAEATIIHIKDHLDSVRSGLPDYLALLNFTLSHGLMKYFGHEVHGTRAYVLTYSPYLDDEFIEFILKTPTVDLDKRAMLNNMKKDIWNTRRGQMVYLPIIKENYATLMNIPTGRHYSPSQLLSVFYPLSVIPALIKKQMGSQKGSFGSEQWITKITDKYQSKLRGSESCHSLNLPPYDVKRFESYAKHLSLMLWLSALSSTSKDEVL